MSDEDNPNAGKVVGIRAHYNNRVFYFDIKLVREFSNYYKGALTQQFVSAIVPTAFGDVEVYGYVDELMPQSVHDIKTTGPTQTESLRIILSILSIHTAIGRMACPPCYSSTI